MLAWPKFLGLGLAVFAVGFLLSTAGDFFRLGYLFTGPSFVVALAWVGLGCFLLVLSYMLYRGHNWARLALVGVTLFALILALRFSVYDVARQHLAVDGDGSKITDQEIRSVRRDELVLRSMSAGSAIMALVPLAWLLGLLLHPDVVAAFRRSGTRRETDET